jgi:hypothetical protein
MALRQALFQTFRPLLRPGALGDGRSQLPLNPDELRARYDRFGLRPGGPLALDLQLLAQRRRLLLGLAGGGLGIQSLGGLLVKRGLDTDDLGAGLLDLDGRTRSRRALRCLPDGDRSGIQGSADLSADVVQVRLELRGQPGRRGRRLGLSQVFRPDGP